MMLTNFYLYMRTGYGFRKSFRFTFGVTLRDFLLGVLIYAAATAMMAAGITVVVNHIVDEVFPVNNGG